MNRRDVGQNRAPRLEHRVPGGDDGVEHGLEEQAVAHPLADQHVIRVGAAELHVAFAQQLLHLALDDGYPVVDAVVRDVGARARRHRRRAVHADDRGRASRAANIERMPVPHPTSSTLAPFISEGLRSNASLYAAVRGTSSSIVR